jgi:6-phosphogluconolactonase
VTGQVTVEVLADPQTLADVVADRLLALLASAQAEGRSPQIALTGGTVADLLHRAVAARSPGSEVDWSRVVIWFGDERFVAPGDADRNAGQARAALLDAVGVPDENLHEMPSTADAPDVDAGATAYSEDLRTHGAGEFDLVMLGMGPDGHVASLFPGFPQVQVEDRIAVGVTGSPKPPPERISLTLPALNRAREVWFLVIGSAKASAAASAIADTTPTASSLPAARVHGRVGTTWFLDEAAAELLPD